MPSKQELDGEQARVSRRGAAWIAENLRDTIIFFIRSGGAVKELIVRLKQDGEEFPFEWFRDLRVTLWQRDGTAIVCDIREVQHIKRKWFFLILSPNPVHGENIWTALQQEDTSRIELVADEEHLLFVWQEDLRFYKRQEVH